MSPELALRRAVAHRWWGLADSQIRVATTLIAMASEAGTLTVELVVRELADICHADRMTIRRALAALTKVGFCSVASVRGRHGKTTVTICRPPATDHLEVSETVQTIYSDGVHPTILDVESRPFTASHSVIRFNQVEQPDLVEKSLAALGDLSRSKPPDPTISADHLDSKFVANHTNSPVSSRARDQDLLRSLDLRSSDLEINTRSFVATRARRDRGIMTTPPKEHMDTEQPASESVAVTAEPTSSHKPRRRVDPTKIPEKAWAAADYLRYQTLAKNGAAVVGMRPWTAGWSWESGKMARTGDGSRTGLRLSWANSFRLFHAVLKGALANGGQPATDEYTWDQIAKTIFWLFHRQPNGVGFVVECPDTLRAKWDRIQACRVRPSDTKPGAAQPLRPRYDAADDLPAGVRRR